MWKFIDLRLYAVAIGDIYDKLKLNLFNMLLRFNQLSYDCPAISIRRLEKTLV
jgi:hypothetical protein